MVPHLHRLPCAQAESTPDAIVTVVSGLPRSGTSMLMQMLGAGGMRVLSDGRRPPDDDNPRGYFELEAAKALDRDSLFLDQAHGQVVKIVVPLLRGLPRKPGRRYRVVVSQRSLDEVMASQSKMLERAGQSEAERDAAALARAFGRELVAAHDQLAVREDIEVLFVHYPEVVGDPATTARALAAFLGGALDVPAMVAAVDASLHRQRCKG